MLSVKREEYAEVNNTLSLKGLQLKADNSQLYDSTSSIYMDYPYKYKGINEYGDLVSYGLQAYWREMLICENGVAKKIMVFATESFPTDYEGRHAGQQF
jgi:hypothetical protein